MRERTIGPEPAELPYTPPRVAPRRASGEVAGAATVRGTAGYAKRHASRFVDGFHRSGPRRLTVSALGVGTYLGDHACEEDDAYADAVLAALRAGVNLIDTAINYRCQRSERAIGRALREAMKSGVVSRDEVVLCSKGGYVPLDGAPPETREAYETYLESTYLARGLMHREELVSGGHCIAPAFLADQVRRSLDNLDVSTLDVYYVHCPEQQLGAVSYEELLARLRAAFECLEACADAGEIGVYGVATWQSLRVPPGHREHLALIDLVRTAHEVAGDANRFRVVQLPASLAMPEAVRVPTQPLARRRRVPALEAATELGLTAIVSAPLMQGRLAQGLPPEVAELFPGCRTDAQRALAFAHALPGATATLVGMRRREHLEENLEMQRLSV